MNDDTNERFGRRRYGIRWCCVEIYRGSFVPKSFSTKVHETNVVCVSLSNNSFRYFPQTHNQGALIIFTKP